MNQRVVITGTAALTACGESGAKTWQAIQQGQTGIAKITEWDVTESDFQLAGEIKNFQPRNLIQDRKLLKLISKQDVLGLNVVDQVLASSQLLEYRTSLTENEITQFNDRSGIYIGSPGNKYNQQYDFMPLLKEAAGDLKKFGEKLFEQVHPMWLLKILPNNVLAYAGIQNGFKGPNHNITNHGVSGMQAIAEAYHAIKAGYIDRAIVVAYDAVVEPQSQLYYGELGTLSNCAIKPFDAKRDGTILADGAGAIILESYTAAKQRGATLQAEILAAATTSEAKGVFAIDTQAEGVTRLLQTLLDNAKMAASDIGMFTAHANGTLNSDATEALAINKIFGNHAVPVTGFKWALGHTVAAAGVLDTIFSVKALQEKNIPGINTFKQLASDCQGLNVSNQTSVPTSSFGIICTRGFAGLNSGIVIAGDVA